MAGAIEDLAAQLARLPGIGRRTALRLTFHLLKAPEEYTQTLGQAIASFHQRVRQCSLCNNLSEEDPCSLCTDRSRNPHLICVVANVPDLWAIEQSGVYRGLYHVLHGLLAPLDGIGPDDLRLDQLERRVAEGDINEIIIATRPSVEGEATALLISKILGGTKVKVTRIASGIPHGGELEYADRMTLGRAIDDRREF